MNQEALRQIFAKFGTFVVLRPGDKWIYRRQRQLHGPSLRTIVIDRIDVAGIHYKEGPQKRKPISSDTLIRDYHPVDAARYKALAGKLPSLAKNVQPSR